jgi:hypothetical protein
MMDDKGNRVILLGNADEKISPLTQLHIKSIPIIPPEFALDRLIEKEASRFFLPKRKCALKECGKEFRPSTANECCCTKEHYEILKNKHK